MKQFRSIALAGFMIGSISLGFIGSIFTLPAIPGWYAGLHKPSFSPPNWVFGPVWTLLYAMMGIAAYLIWLKQGKAVNVARTRALFVFGVQFALNILWSWLFFGLKSPVLGLTGIFMLWLAILATITTFRQISKPAALFLLPYIIWVTFAGFLNGAIYLSN
jgi:tryptophan-rich sensory protein